MLTNMLSQYIRVVVKKEVNTNTHSYTHTHAHIHPNRCMHADTHTHTLSVQQYPAVVYCAIKRPGLINASILMK